MDNGIKALKHIMTSNDWRNRFRECKPEECCGCPFGTAMYKETRGTMWDKAPNIADEGEGYYKCSLLGKKDLWGEAPTDCTEEQWAKLCREGYATLEAQLAEAQERIADLRDETLNNMKGYLANLDSDGGIKFLRKILTEVVGKLEAQDNNACKALKEKS